MRPQHDRPTNHKPTKCAGVITAQAQEGAQLILVLILGTQLKAVAPWPATLCFSGRICSLLPQFILVSHNSKKSQNMGREGVNVVSVLKVGTMKVIELGIKFTWNLPGTWGDFLPRHWTRVLWDESRVSRSVPVSEGQVTGEQLCIGPVDRQRRPWPQSSFYVQFAYILDIFGHTKTRLGCFHQGREPTALFCTDQKMHKDVHKSLCRQPRSALREAAGRAGESSTTIASGRERRHARLPQ